MEVITADAVKRLLPKRSEDGDKFAFGKVLCIAGSMGFTGAPYFASLAAQRSGCGLVRLVVPESIWAVEATKLNEVMVIGVEDDDDGRLSGRAFSKILDIANKSDAVLIGPGCGINRGVQGIVKGLLTSIHIPMVIDADGINVLCEDRDMLKFASCPIVLTPHSREFARLYGSRPKITDQLLKDFAIDYNVTLVYKSAETTITTPDNRIILNKAHANSGMAKGGSGDVLAGIITSFLAQGLNTTDASILGVYVHSRAGKCVRDKIGERGMLPSDVLNELPLTLKSL